MTGSRQQIGLAAQQLGASWENLFMSVASRQRIACTRIPDGCRQVGQSRVLRVKTPFDWILTYNGRTALLDTKATASPSFPHSAIESSQMRHLLLQESHGALAGYLIWFRKLDQVVFVKASELERRSKERGSITPGQLNTLNVGPALTCRLASLFDAASV